MQNLQNFVCKSAETNSCFCFNNKSSFLKESKSVESVFEAVVLFNRKAFEFRSPKAQYNSLIPPLQRVQF